MATKKEALAKKPGLYANIEAKKKRIEKGSGETMQKKGTEDTPDEDAFREPLRPLRRNNPRWLIRNQRHTTRSPGLLQRFARGACPMRLNF